jgi:hypothetical protein
VHACFAADDEAETSGRPRQLSARGGDGGWVITNASLWDHVLKMVNAETLEARRPGRAILLEFARPDMVRSIADNFDPEIRRSSLLLYIFCPVDICWERNQRRHEAAVAAGTDDHLVSREEMEKTYLRDDHYRLHTLGAPFLLVDNHMEGSALLDYAIQEIVAVLKAN